MKNWLSVRNNFMTWLSEVSTTFSIFRKIPFNHFNRPFKVKIFIIRNEIGLFMKNFLL